MSTMRVTNLKNESSSVNQIVLNSDGTFGGELASTFLPIAGGKILQIVRATDTTQRTTTSTSFVDVTGMSVTITPQISTSAIIVFASVSHQTNAASFNGRLRISDSSNNALSGAEDQAQGPSVGVAQHTIFGYATPGTTSAVTYKLRFRVDSSGTDSIRNDVSAGQLYAIEVSA